MLGSLESRNIEVILPVKGRHPRSGMLPPLKASILGRPGLAWLTIQWLIQFSPLVVLR